MSWTREWPKGQGEYWFYGKPSRFFDKPKMYFVRVWKTANSFAYVMEGSFMFESEADGVWQKAILPAPPQEETKDE